MILVPLWDQVGKNDSGNLNAKNILFDTNCKLKANMIGEKYYADRINNGFRKYSDFHYST